MQRRRRGPGKDLPRSIDRGFWRGTRGMRGREFDPRRRKFLHIAWGEARVSSTLVRNTLLIKWKAASCVCGTILDCQAGGACTGLFKFSKEEMSMSISVSRPLIAGLLVGLLGVGHANAALISGTGAPSANAALAGSTTIDFSATSTGTYSSLALAGVTIDAAPGKTFVVTDNLGGLTTPPAVTCRTCRCPAAQGSSFSVSPRK